MMTTGWRTGQRDRGGRASTRGDFHRGSGSGQVGLEILGSQRGAAHENAVQTGQLRHGAKWRGLGCIERQRNREG